MASTSWLSYQRLRQGDPGGHPAAAGRPSWPTVIRRQRRRWRRPRIRVAGLRRLLRRKTRVVGAAVRKVVRRLKEGKPYFGELFAGNYMFMQVTSVGFPDKYSFAPPPTKFSLPTSQRVVA